MQQELSGSRRRSLSFILARAVVSLLTVGAMTAARAQGPASAGGTATVEGRVQLARPAPITVASPRYQLPATGQAAAVPEPPAAVVYLEGPFPARPKPDAAAMQQMAQRNATFVPGVLPIQVGTLVEFPNQDDFYHNVFSYSKPKHFDLGRYRRDEKPATQLFDKPGVVTLHCEIHESMRGTILVLDTPYFVKTDPAGNFRLEGLPAGRYTLKAWRGEKAVAEHPIELKERTVAHVDFP